MTEDLDTGIGMIMEGVERLGIGNNTYLIYMSDNGGGARGVLKGGKGSLWEGGIRVPLIVRGPGVPENSICHERVVGYDLFPTFCDLAGVTAPLPNGIEGGSIVSLLSGAAKRVKRPGEELVFHFPHYQSSGGPQSAILLGDLKLLRFYETGEQKLFDLSRDIGEWHDLSQEMPEKVVELTARIERYLEDVGAALPVPNPSYDPDNPTQDRRERSKPRGGRGDYRRRGSNRPGVP